MYINVKPEEMNTVASNIENKISEWQAAVQKPVSYTHLTLPTNSRV